MGHFNKLYITFFFPNIQVKCISICLYVFKGSLPEHWYSYAKGYTEIELLWSPFCFCNGQGNKNKLLTCGTCSLLLQSSSVRLLVQTIQRFLSGSLPFSVSLGKVTFLAAKPCSVFMRGDAMPNRMNGFHKIIQFHTLEFEKQVRL